MRKEEIGMRISTMRNKKNNNNNQKKRDKNKYNKKKRKIGGKIRGKNKNKK